MNSLTKYLIEQVKGKTTAVYGGGFKVPTRGHFEVAQIALEQNPEIDEFIIFVGEKPRDGITQAQSVLIWEIYKRYLPFKVTVIPTKVAPIRAVYDYAKEHPQDEVLWVIGVREGNEEDFKDLASRTKSIDKYPNLELRTIVTSNGVSGTAARNALQVSDEKFLSFLPNELENEEKQEVLDIVAKAPIEAEPEELTEQVNIDYKQYIKSLTQKMIEDGKTVEPLPKVIFKNDETEAEDFFGKTAYYEPASQTIVLYVKDRHPKDIVRSFAHEMIHHIQNLEGRLGDITTTNTNEDDALLDIEKEAYLDGNITFRNWTDSLTGNKLEEKKKKDYFGLNAYAAELARLREDEEEYEIFVDMDGVVADFNKRFFDIADMLPSEFEEKYGKDKFWDLIADYKKEFWSEIPMMWDAKALIDYVKQYPYQMLTAPSSKKDSLIGKTIWMRMHTNKLFGGDRPKVIFRKADNKQEFAAPNKILIDDRAKTIDQWNAKGGIGILHTSAENTIKQLKKLGL